MTRPPRAAAAGSCDVLEAGWAVGVGASCTALATSATSNSTARATRAALVRRADASAPSMVRV